MPLPTHTTPYATLAIVSPDLVRTGDARLLREHILDAGLMIMNGIRRRLDASAATFLTRAHLGRPYFPALVSHLTAGPVLLLQVSGPDPISRLHQLVTHGTYSWSHAPRIDGLPALYCSHSPDDARRDLAFVGFESPFLPSLVQEPRHLRPPTHPLQPTQRQSA